MTSPPAETDGRTARAVRTRDAVVEAFLSLIDEGHLRPTARQVSERAGVSLRSVFQHFADLETLFAAASDRQVERISRLVVPVPADLPFEARVRAFVDSHCALLEAVSPVRRAALLQAPFSPEIAKRLEWFRETRRAELRRLFAAEIARAGTGSRLLEAALQAATEWQTWETLRVHENLTESEAREAMALMVSALLRKEP